MCGLMGCVRLRVGANCNSPLQYRPYGIVLMVSFLLLVFATCSYYLGLLRLTLSFLFFFGLVMCKGSARYSAAFFG